MCCCYLFFSIVSRWSKMHLPNALTDLKRKDPQKYALLANIPNAVRAITVNLYYIMCTLKQMEDEWMLNCCMLMAKLCFPFRFAE